jgi:amino acid adenylation domain-containing protein
VFPRELLDHLRAVSRENGSTLFVTLLAAFDVLLSRLSGQDDIVVGSPTAGRSHESTEGLIGYFANTLVLRTRLDGDPSFSDVVARVREATLSAFEHQEMPYEKLALELQRERAFGRAGLFQVMFTLQDAERRQMRLPGLAFEPFGTGRGSTKFDLSLIMHEREEGLLASFEYRTDLFDEATIDRMLGRLEVLLQAIVRAPSMPISKLPIVPDQERALLLGGLTRGESVALDAETLHEMIARQVARTPNAVALEVEGPSGRPERMTFRELDERAEILATYLSSVGVGPNAGVGVCIERSFELVVAMLGTLKAGSYYLPLDPEYPADRLAFMLEDAHVPVLLTVEGLAASLPRVEKGPRVVLLDRDWTNVAEAARHAGRRPAWTPTGDALAYLIYTSGSTGKPKGVMVPHRSVVNYLTWMRSAFPLDTADAVLQKAPASFDACIWEFFLPLVSGARLVLARPGAHQDPAYLANALAKHDVTLLQLVPSQLQMMLETPGLDARPALSRLRRLFLGGEALPSELLARLGALCPTLPVTNLYGPTEATVYATSWSLVAGEWSGGRVPIGAPIANVTVHVVRATPQGEPFTPELVPFGVPGELCIAGLGLAHGYLNRPSLTDEKFVRSPFAARRGALMYRTGDRVCLRADGTLEYLGRLDNQVKVRGFRIELGEIEAALAQQPGVQAAVVLVREDTPGDQRLVAYCIAVPGADTSGHTRAALRRALKATLPEFMVPSAFVWMDGWPLNANGKLDRKALPRPEVDDAPVAASVAPRTPTEAVIASLWGELLQRELGVEDDFFELGGHSLLALRVLGRVSERFGIRVPLRTLFEASTVEAFARRIDELASAAARAPERAEPIPRVGTEAPLTHMQELFWLVERNAPTLGVYNVAEQWEVQGPLDLHALRHALDALVDRHEALRTSVIERDDGPVQVVGAPRPVPLDVVDLAALAPDTRASALRRAVAERSAEPFDLAAGLLVRATLVRTAPDAHVLLLVSHHLVYDGWSRGILVRELSALYARARGERAAVLPAIPVRLVDYAAWQRRRLDDGAIAGELEGWLARLRGSALTIDLPTDRARPVVPSFEGSKRITVFSTELLERLRRLARETDTTLFMVLLAGFQSLLHRHSGQEDLVVGTIVAGRPRPELEHIVGNFVNSVPLRASFADDPTFLDLLAQAKEEYLYASEHAELPFETLNAALQRERGAEAAGFGQILFVLQNNAPSALRLTGTSTRGASMETATTKFDLSLSMGEQANGLRAAVQYRSALFDASTIDRMLTHLGTLLDAACRAPETPVSTLPILSADERQRILFEWNDTTTDYPRDAAVHDLIAEQAARTPGAVAVTAAGRSLTYGELEVRSNQLAWHLRNTGVGQGSVVGVCIEPSLDLVVAMLASLKAGAAYLALDPSYPAERIGFMVEESRIAALVTSGDAMPSIAPGNWTRVSMTADATAIDAQAVDAPPSHTTGGDVLNIVYTSGSTGRPKGTMLPHRGIVRLVVHTNYMELGSGDAMAQMASPAFDAVGLEVWGPLLNGARIEIIPRDVMLDPPALKDALQRSGVTALFITTAVFNHVARTVPDAFRGVRTVTFGGEAADAEALRRVREHSDPENLRNVYGPTETSVFATSYDTRSLAQNAASVPIGRPIANTRVYVLDAHQQPVPVGVTGELYIGGDGTAFGYLERDELTTERFVRNPVVAGSTERIYRTGDLVRWLPTGDIEFVGRRDNQVKLRGVRIELGEIEAVVAADPAVSAALALVREVAPGDTRLLCYYVPAAGAAPEQGRIRAALRRALPQTMLPSAVIELPAFPLTPNGKIDRRALPLPAARTPRAPSYKAPRTTIEHELVHVWEQLLERQPIGVREDFFELGGHSLLAVRMLAEIGRLRGRHVPLSWLFESSTIEALAARIDDAVQSTKEPPIIVLQPNASGTPLAFVHGDVRGAGLYCRRLAPLVAPDAPFLVLPTLGAERGGPVWRIESMAEHHLAELRKVRPHGPYRLGGFCVGGMIAFEMARQLQAAGETVERLILIDSAPTNAALRFMRPVIALMLGSNEQLRIARQAHFMKRLRRYQHRIRQVRRLSAVDQLRWVGRNIARRCQRLPELLGFGTRHAPAAGSARPKTVMTAKSLADALGEQVLLSQAYAASSFIPKPADVSVDLIWAEDRPNVTRTDPTRGWWRLTPQVRTHHIHAHHLGLITNELPRLAATMRAILEHEGR